MTLKLLLLFTFRLAFTFAQLPSCGNFSFELESNQRGCSWYWRCRDEEENLLTDPIEELCPHNLHFNRYTQSCGENDGSCPYDEQIFSSTPLRCTDFRMDLIPHVFECQKYFLCWRNYTIPLECPEGEHFSYFQNGCTNPELADCLTEHHYCRRMKNEGVTLKRSPHSCETFHLCNKCNNRFSLIELKCANGTHQFDEVNGQCDDAEKVQCEPEPQPGDENYEKPPYPLSVFCSAEDIREGFVAHPEDCHYYFNCASGRSRLHKCPKNSYFDLERGECWEHDEGFECPKVETTTEPETTPGSGGDCCTEF